MDFSLSEEQQMLVDSARTFAEKELYPYEDEVESGDEVRPELAQQIRERAIAQGFYAANMPEELGGGGLDNVSLSLVERELGRANFALQYLVGRPSNILQACVGEQRDHYLLPCIRGEKTDCLAMTEPGAGSDLRSMQCRAERGIFLGRDVDADHPVDARARRFLGEPFRPAPHHRVGITHQHQRHVGVPRAELVGDHQHVLRGGARLQCADIRRLDRGPVRHRIGEGHPQLDHIRSAFDQRVEIGSGIAIARGDEAHQRRVGLCEGGCDSVRVVHRRALGAER